MFKRNVISKFHLLIVFCFIGFKLIWSQGEGSSFKVPEITHQAPDVGVLKKINSISLNYYTGVPNISIPLYSFEDSGVKIALSADYFAGGIQVSQESGVLGLGWTLNIGGVISREIRGGDDLKSGGYLKIVNLLPPESTIKKMLYERPPRYIKETRSMANSVYPHILVDRNGEPADFRNYYTADNWTPDLSSDLYSISFPGFSGKFIFDNDGKIQFLKHNGLKVEYDDSEIYGNINWIITDQNGIKYYFDQESTTYSTTSNSNPILGGTTDVYVASWNLTKIEAPNGSLILFNYEKEKIVNIPKLSEVKLHNELVNDFSCSLFGIVENKAKTVVESEVNLMKSVNFTNGKIEFNYVKDRLDLKNASRLANITIKDCNGIIINKFQFDNDAYFDSKEDDKGYYEPNNTNYAMSHWSKRLKLKKISEFGKNQLKSLDHIFSYSTKRLPFKSSYSVDHWGYYNGDVNSLPKNNSYIPEIKYGFNSNLLRVDRSYNSIFVEEYDGADIRTISGANRNANIDMDAANLIKIQYPTKGYKEFKYSPNQLKINEKIIDWVNSGFSFSKDEDQSYIIHEYGSKIDTINSDVNFAFEITADDYDFELNYKSGGNKYHTRQLKLEGIWSCNNCLSNLLPTDSDNNVLIGIFKSLDGNIQENIYWKGQIDNNGFILGLDKELLLPIGKYKIEFLNKMKFLSGVDAFNKSKFLFGISWKHANGEKVIQNTKLLGGLKVDEVKTFESGESLPITKKIIYEGGKLMSSPSYKMGYRIPNFDNDPPLTANNNLRNHYAVLKISSSTINPNSTSANGRIMGYSKVVEEFFGKETGRNEYIYFNEKPSYLYSFNSDADFDGYIGFVGFHGFPVEESIKNGLLLDYKQFNHKGDTINFEKYNYAASSLFTNEINKKIYHQLSPTLLFSVFNEADLSLRNYYYTFTYRINTEWLRLDNIVKIKDGIEELTKYKYDLNTKLVLEEETTTSNNGISKIKTFYPENINDLSSLGTIDSLTQIEYNSIDNLKSHNRNRINTPIQIEYYKDDILLFTKRTNYREWGLNNPNKGIVISPEFIQSVKGEITSINLLEDRIIYHDYDDRGNPLEVSKADGTHIVYLWGYKKSQPIAKIEHATYMEVKNTLLQLQNPITIAALELASDQDNDSGVDSIDINGVIQPNGKEGLLRQLLNRVREALPNSQITTYTYDPLIGITSITDPRGEVIYYHYDAFNRLEYVKDSNGNILSKNEYHYKGQQ